MQMTAMSKHVAWIGRVLPDWSLVSTPDEGLDLHQPRNLRPLPLRRSTINVVAARGYFT
jgi:hypothetical protein